MRWKIEMFQSIPVGPDLVRLGIWTGIMDIMIFGNKSALLHLVHFWSNIWRHLKGNHKFASSDDFSIETFFLSDLSCQSSLLHGDREIYSRTLLVLCLESNLLERELEEGWSRCSLDYGFSEDKLNSDSSTFKMH